MEKNVRIVTPLQLKNKRVIMNAAADEANGDWLATARKLASKDKAEVQEAKESFDKPTLFYEDEE